MTITATSTLYPGAGSATDATSYTTGTITTVAGDRVLVAVGSHVTSGNPNVPTVAGLGVGWTQIGTVFNGVLRNTFFTGVCATSVTDLAQISFGGQTQLRCCYSFTGFRSSLGSPITLGTFATNSGTAAAAGSVTVVNPGGGDGVWAGIYAGGAATAFTKDANYTAADSLAAGAEAGRMHTQYLINSVSDLTANWTWATNSTWLAGGVVLLEPVPAVFPDVVVGGAKKTVVGMNVVVGGVKKTVVNQWVVVAGVKKPMV